MNSLLSTYIQLHQPRLYTHFFSEATLIHPVMININTIRSKINKKGKNLTINIIFHLNNGCLVSFLLVFHNYINLRNVMANIPNYLCLLSAIDLWLAILVQWKIFLAKIFSTYPTLQWSLTITYVLFLSRL